MKLCFLDCVSDCLLHCVRASVFIFSCSNEALVKKPPLKQIFQFIGEVHIPIRNNLSIFRRNFHVRIYGQRNEKPDRCRRRQADRCQCERGELGKDGHRCTSRWVDPWMLTLCQNLLEACTGAFSQTHRVGLSYHAHAVCVCSWKYSKNVPTDLAVPDCRYVTTAGRLGGFHENEHCGALLKCVDTFWLLFKSDCNKGHFT